jgi:DNA-directed RNA polymerase specialized sigma24 family protein
VGTIKSRVNRARAKLAEILTVETVDEEGERSDDDLTSRVA